MIMDTIDFKNWFEYHHIEERTIKGWWNALNNIKTDEPESFIEYFGDDFNEKLMVIKYEKVGLYLSNRLIENNVYVASYAFVEYGGKGYGTYKLVFDLAGQVLDDFWLGD